MGTHPIFESDFDCLTDETMTSTTHCGLAHCRDVCLRSQGQFEYTVTQSLVRRYSRQLCRSKANCPCQWTRTGPSRECWHDQGQLSNYIDKSAQVWLFCWLEKNLEQSSPYRNELF